MTPYSFPPNQITTIYNDAHEKLTVLKGSTEHKSFFDAVLKLRSEAYKTPPEPEEMDYYSELYILARDNKPIATARITEGKRGKMECEEFYPKQFLSRYRDITTSTTRLAKAPSEPSNPLLMALFIQEMGRELSKRGLLINLSNTQAKLVPYQRLIGFKILCGSFFLHPKFNTPSYVMIALADPRHPCLVQDAFREITDFALLDQILSEVPVCKQECCPALQTPTCSRQTSPANTLPSTNL